MITLNYIGRSFNDKPIRETAAGPLGSELFVREQEDLLSDHNDIPKKACDRRINEFVKRARSAKVHAHIVGHLKNQMPALMGKAKAQQKLLETLDEQFAKVQKEMHLPPGDFPNVDEYRDTLSAYNFDRFERLHTKMMKDVDDMLAYDIPDLLKQFRNPYE